MLSFLDAIVIFATVTTTAAIFMGPVYIIIFAIYKLSADNAQSLRNAAKLLIFGKIAAETLIKDQNDMPSASRLIGANLDEKIISISQLLAESELIEEPYDSATLLSFTADHKAKLLAELQRSQQIMKTTAIIEELIIKGADYITDGKSKSTINAKIRNSRDLIEKMAATLIDKKLSVAGELALEFLPTIAMAVYS